MCKIFKSSILSLLVVFSTLFFSIPTLGMEDTENDDSPSKRKRNPIVWPDGVKLTKQDEMALRIIQRSLYLDGSSESPLSEVSPNRVEDYRQAGGKTPQLRKIIEGARKHLQPIHNLIEFPNPDTSPNSQPPIFSPVARVVLSRTDILKAKETGAVVSLPARAHVVPIRPETEEERALRKERQAQAFLEAAERQGLFKVQIDARMQQEYDLWEHHMNYMKFRKRQILGFDELETEDEEIQSEEDETEEVEIPVVVAKIRKGEIEDSFANFVAPKLEFFQIGQYTVYYSGISLDLEFECKGKTNLERMEQGINPIGWDGKSMEFHHLTHHDSVSHKVDSVIVLITSTLHKMPGLHFGKNTYADRPKALNRRKFHQARTGFNTAIAEILDSKSVITK